MRKQSLFIENSSCFVTQSKAKAVKITPHSRSRLCPGQGAYVGGRGFAKGTELFYSGLIYHGEYNENLMLETWKKASTIRLPDNWKGKVFKVLSQKLYIIGNPEAWTSDLNYPGHNSSYHASIIGERAIIKFDHAAFSFEEIFVDYAEHLTLTSHHAPYVRRKIRFAVPIANGNMSQETAEGERLLTDSIILKYNVGNTRDPEAMSLFSQNTPNTEKDWHWHQEQKNNFDLGIRPKKKQTEIPCHPPCLWTPPLWTPPHYHPTHQCLLTQRSHLMTAPQYHPHKCLLTRPSRLMTPPHRHPPHHPYLNQARTTLPSVDFNQMTISTHH